MNVLEEVFKCGYSAYANQEDEFFEQMMCWDLKSGNDFIGKIVGELNSNVKIVRYRNDRNKKRLALVNKENIALMMEVLYISELKQGTAIVCIASNNHIDVGLLNERAERVLDLGYRKKWMSQKLRTLIKE